MLRKLKPAGDATAAHPSASKGNKTEAQSPLLFSVIMSLPVIGLHIYYLWFQTFVYALNGKLSNCIAHAE